MSGPNRTVTPHDRSLAMLSVNAGCAAWAWLLKGTATSGSFLPIASTKIPRARVSQMPAAHLLIVFTVAGAMMIASGAGRTSGSSGSLYSLRTGYPVSRSNPATSANRRPGRGREDAHVPALLLGQLHEPVNLPGGWSCTGDDVQHPQAHGRTLARSASRANSSGGEPGQRCS